MSDWIIRSSFALINWIINQFYKLYKEIDVEEVTQVAEDVIEDGPPAVAPPLNPVARTIFIVIASLVIAIVIFFLVKKIIQLIRWITEKASDTMSTGKRKKKDIENEEFEEIVEDLDKKKDKSRLRRAPKFKYTINGLKGLDTYKEKVRYLYGYALERLMIKKIEISKADTPEQILEKLNQQEHGDEFANDMFDEFTDEYIDVRYGDKDKLQDESLNDKADMLDRGINKIKPNKKED
jgi:large-conductance mechanosensitive channel